MALKEQLRAQEEDTENYIAKVTYQEKVIETQERNYDILQLQLEEDRITNANLIERNEELSKLVDSLKATNAELQQMKCLSEKSGFGQMMSQAPKSVHVEFGMQIDETQWQDFLSQYYRQQRQTEQEAAATITSTRSGIHTGTKANTSFPNSGGFGVGLFPNNHNSRVLEHLSDVISGEQGEGYADFDRV